MAAISRANELKQLLPGLNALFGEEYNNYENEHEQIYVSENSERSFEEELKLSGFAAAPVKDEGAAISYDVAQESFVARYTHETIALGFSVTEEAMEDNLYVSLSARYTKALARAMAYTKQVKAAALLNNGFTSSFQSGDGVNLFTAEGDGVTGGDGHPLVNGGKNSNRPVVVADLNETSLEDNIIDISTFVDDKNLIIAVRPDKLIVPPQLVFVADRLLNTPGRTATSDNDINSIKNQSSIPNGFSVNHYLTDPDAYYILTSVNEDGEGLKMFNRTPMETTMEPEFSTGNIRYRARERYSFGVSNWRGVFASQGA